MPKLLQVIESHISRGEGSTWDPCRTVRQYHTGHGPDPAMVFDGERLNPLQREGTENV